jgi:hypothetical protein
VPVSFVALDTETVTAYRAGAVDANGLPAEQAMARESGLPCRHCLDDIRRGQSYLTLAHRPFPAPQPYAEVGPIFLHAETCPRGGGHGLPAFLDSPRYILRGYGEDHRILYGTGQIVETVALVDAAERLLTDPRVAYAHIRSATNNCFHCRVERA